MAVMRARTMGNIGRLPQSMRLQELLQGLALFRADIDQEIVGHIGGQAAPPIGEQIAAHHRQQQQHHQPQAKGDDLHHAAAAAPRDVGEPIAPGDAHAAAQPAREPHQAVTRQR